MDEGGPSGVDTAPKTGKKHLVGGRGMIPLQEEVPCTGGENFVFVTHCSYSSAPLGDSTGLPIQPPAIKAR